MPPANSRAASPPEASQSRTETTPYFLSALRELENPVSSSVLNLASTLNITSPEEDVAAENLRFLRTPLDPQEEWRAENAQERLRERLRRTAEQRSEDRERRERLQRVLSRLSRIQEPPSYSDHTPTQNNLYDWSPSPNVDGDEDLEALIRELRQQRPATHPDVLRHEALIRLERDNRIRHYTSRLLNTNQPSQTSESSLRSAAILQSVRRHPRLSARSREYMQRYIADRDTTSRETQANGDQERQSPSRSNSTMQALREQGGRYDQNRRSWLAEQNHVGFLERTRPTGERDYWRSRIDSYRRPYIDNPTSPTPSAPSVWLEHTIRYLSNVRNATSYDDSLSFALDAGFVTKEFFGDTHDDFILDLSALPILAETSWLRPGAVLSGSQHATTAISSSNTAESGLRNSTSDPVPRNSESSTSTRPWIRDHWVPPHARRADQTYSTQTPSQDRWPVKVAIHTVDYKTMSLTATMEAYNVPSQPYSNVLSPSYPSMLSQSSNRSASITTYLEGEILDLRTHSFLTESFKSDALNDASYWRMLPPFSTCSDDELVRNLVSKKWLTNELCNEYVLMRWKERCFVKSRHTTRRNDDEPASSDRRRYVSAEDEEEIRDGRRTEEEIADGCGLTISGFYYVSLRRSDGAVEGLYCDPQSSPYQHLKLKSVGGGVFPVWEFR